MINSCLKYEQTNYIEYKQKKQTNKNEYHVDAALHLSIPGQGLPNGETTLPHTSYPGIQPYAGVGMYIK